MHVFRLRFGVSTPGGPLAGDELTAISDAVGEDPSLILWFEDFSMDPPLSAIDAVASRGASPVTTWEPRLWRGARRAVSVESIAAGKSDAYLRRWAEALSHRDDAVYLRFAHEFNGTWYPWSAAGGTSAETYVAAWRHLHQVFGGEGAASVRWVWSPTVSYPGIDSALAQWYPGDEYVDAFGVDGYNWGDTHAGRRWTDPVELFADTLAEVRQINASTPILVTEVGCAETGGDKPRWITEFVGWLDTQPGVDGFVWFDHDKETDWRFTSGRRSASAMAAALRHRIRKEPT